MSFSVHYKVVLFDVFKQHIDLWVDYMWHVRPDKCNWAMVSTYFVQLLLQNSIPLFYVDGRRYPIPWANVDEVKLNSLLRDNVIYLVMISCDNHPSLLKRCRFLCLSMKLKGIGVLPNSTSGPDWSHSMTVGTLLTMIAVLGMSG